MVMVTGHVGINVTNLERSQRFYSEALGLQSMGASSDPARPYVFLGDGTNLVLTLWQQSGGRFDSGTPGLHHLAFKAASIEEVLAAERRLLASGTKFVYQGIVPHAEGRDSGGIFFEDPDGTRLEIYAATGAAAHHAPTGAAPSCGFF